MLLLVPLTVKVSFNDAVCKNKFENKTKKIIGKMSVCIS